MAKKRKAGGKKNGGFETHEIDPADSKLNVQSWEDVADSEDEFHLHRDKILLEEEPSRKRQRLQAEQDMFYEPSDEEVLAVADDDSELEGEDTDEDESDDGDESLASQEEKATKPSKSTKNKGRDDMDSVSAADEDGEREEGWGSSKRDYYDADQIETEADALEEEQEALRLQKKQLQGMTEADYGFDENEWLGSKEDEQDEDQEGVVQEILPDLKITDDMPAQERSKILFTRYPEFDPLAKEFLALQPLHEDLMLAENAAKAVLAYGGTDTSVTVPVASIKRSALGGYLAALSMYFAVLSSGSRKTNGEAVAKPPAELRDHPIMETLMQTRQLWDKVKDIAIPEPAELIKPQEPATAVNGHADTPTDRPQPQPKPKKKRKTKAEKAAVRARLEAEAQRAEEDRRLQARLASIAAKAQLRFSKPTSSVQIVNTTTAADDDSDFGEETSLTAEEAAEKSRRKKGLRFYTSQIVQKDNKRGAAGRDAGGDNDIPHRERLKDRQARLNVEAEARGRKKDGKGAGEKLGGDSDEDDARVAKSLRADGDEEYYQTIAAKTQAKKDAKAARAAVERDARAQGGRVVEEEVVGADGRREITYAIEKNKGLTPRRSKDVRNPRVKKRKKYEEKKKKLSSVRAVYKPGGEGRGGYKGELTGIRTGIVKSRKL